MPLLVSSLEKLYHRMWQDFKKERLPKPDLANLDIYLEVGAQMKHDEIEIQTIEDYRAWWQVKCLQYHKHHPLSRGRAIY